MIRLYVSSTSSSTELVLHTDYVRRILAPVWFSIQVKPVHNGSKTSMALNKLSRFVSESKRRVVD